MRRVRRALDVSVRRKDYVHRGVKYLSGQMGQQAPGTEASNVARLIDVSLDNVTDRFLTEGAIYRDLRDLRRRIERLEDWPAAWAETAAEMERRAAALVSSGAPQSAA